ncbi:MAG: hypothetical protein ACLRMM_06010, partial [Ruminococcus callidus]|uniref:hypothetical protein n=1 Tax=Ruminococcus callidus TaxID=40519 RepID=UPI0039A33B89
LPAQHKARPTGAFSREPFLPYSPPPHNLFTNVKKPRQNDKTAGNQTKHPAPNVLNALLLF